MIRLAVDTALEQLSLALIHDEHLLAEFHTIERRRNASVLFQSLNELLSEVGVKIEEIDAYVVNQGPGSYTGVRIGMALVKTLAQVFRKPVVAVNSLRYLAAQLIHDRDSFKVLLNCTHQELYVAQFKISDSNIFQLSSIALKGLDEVLSGIGSEPVLLHRLKTYKDVWTEKFKKFNLIPPDCPKLNAFLLDQAAIKQSKGGIWDNTFPVNPLYVKKDV